MSKSYNGKIACTQEENKYPTIRLQHLNEMCSILDFIVSAAVGMACHTDCSRHYKIQNATHFIQMLQPDGGVFIFFLCTSNFSIIRF
jgi:hypothetical protein